MINKEILQDLIKKALGDRLTKLEKKNNEEEASLKLIKTSYDGFTKHISSLIKLREQKIAKDKLEEQKKFVDDYVKPFNDLQDSVSIAESKLKDRLTEIL